MSVFRLACLASLGIGSIAQGSAQSTTVDVYRLGPQDKLQVSVYDWRTGAGEAYQWAALNGEFIVGASGTVSLPLLGEIPAGGTTAELATAIADRLQAKIGLAKTPDASVQVIKYRPFFIIGDVEKPGQFDYQPGLTVLQALGAAGGLQRLAGNSLLGTERDALVSRGDLRSLLADRSGLLIRQARLDAEIRSQDAMTVPPEIAARLADPDVARATREERLLFETRRSSLKSQIDVIDQAKTLLDGEVASLAAKAVSLDHQIALTRKDLSQVSDLVSKGIAVMPRQLAAEQSAAAFESSRLDVQVATLRAQQDRSKLDRDIIDLNSKRRSDDLREASEVRGRLADVAEKIDTAQSLIEQAEIRAPLVLADEAAVRRPVFRLTRRADGQSQTTVVEEGDIVTPGDVLRVDLPRRMRAAFGRDLAADALDRAPAAASSRDAAAPN